MHTIDTLTLPRAATASMARRTMWLLPRAWQLLRRRAQSLAHGHRTARARAAFMALDERTLRDLGLVRSELSSVWAEAEGTAEATRQRLVRDRLAAGS